MKQSEVKVVCRYAAEGEALEELLRESFRLYLRRALQTFGTAREQPSGGGGGACAAR